MRARHAAGVKNPANMEAFVPEHSAYHFKYLRRKPAEKNRRKTAYRRVLRMRHLKTL